MIVDDVRPDGGYTWHSTVGPWRLDYDNAVVPAEDGSTLRFSYARSTADIEEGLARLAAFMATR